MIEQTFKTVFGYTPAITGFTPGRVNLIGEHIDYNGGMVLPTALKQGLSIALSPRTDSKVKISSDKFDGIAVRNLSQSVQNDWSDYILGAVIYANKAGFLSGGADICVTSSLPFGAGLSSSAAITVGVLKLARDLAGQNVSNIDIALLAQRIENEFIGVPCGIMDQIAVAIAAPGQALALNTVSLEYRLIELPKDYIMAVIHSGVYRALNEGRYAERKGECDEVKAKLGHKNICLATNFELEQIDTLPEHLKRRARHCVSEHHRTVKAAHALEHGDMQSFGTLLNQGQASIRDDFEITVPEIDRLTERAVALGALEARQTGGGFGGCIIACVANDIYENWLHSLLEEFPKAFDVLKANFEH